MADIKILNQFLLSDDAVIKSIQFSLKAPLGKIPKEQRPVSGEVIISDIESETFQLCTGDNLLDLEIVSREHKKFITDLLYRGFVCLAEVMTFHDLTEADDVRGVVILYTAFFRKGFRLAGGIEIKLSSGILESLRKKGFSQKTEDIRDNFIIDVGNKISRFMYYQGENLQDDESMEGNFLLARARKIGILNFERLPGLENGRTAIHIHRAENGAVDPLEFLQGGETGDSLLEVSEIPVYLQDKAMTWEEFREHEYEEGHDYLQIREIIKNERKIILETQREINGNLILSIRGDLTQINRRKKARDMLKSGQNPNPDIAMIVAHDLKEDNTQTLQ